MLDDDKRVWVTEYVQCTTECGLEAGDQSAARLAQLIIGYVGGCVHAEGSARELILYTLINSRFVSKLLAARLPRTPPAWGGQYVVAQPRLGFQDYSLRWTQAKRPDLICVRYEGPIDFFYQSF